MQKERLELAAQHRLLRWVSSHLQQVSSGNNELPGFGGDWAEFVATLIVPELPKNLAGHR